MGGAREHRPVDLGQDEVTDEIVALVDGLVTRISSHHQVRMAEFGLSGPEARIILELEPEVSFSMRELAVKVQSSPSNLTVTVGRLEAKGVLERRGGDDRRVRSVQLTIAGSKLRNQLRSRLSGDHPAVRGLSRPQLIALLELLRSLDV